MIRKLIIVRLFRRIGIIRTMRCNTHDNSNTSPNTNLLRLFIIWRNIILSLGRHRSARNVGVVASRVGHRNARNVGVVVERNSARPLANNVQKCVEGIPRRCAPSRITIVRLNVMSVSEHRNTYICTYHVPDAAVYAYAFACASIYTHTHVYAYSYTCVYCCVH